MSIIKETETNYSSPTRKVKVEENERLARIKKIGYSNNNAKLLTQDIYNYIAREVYASGRSELIANEISNELSSLANIEREKIALEKGDQMARQFAIHDIKVDLANTLVVMRKKLWNLQIDNGSLIGDITLVLDAIEYSDHLIDNYKPTKYAPVIDEKIVTLPQDHEIAVHMLSEKKQKTLKTNLPLLLLNSFFIAAIVYIIMSHLTEWMAITLGIPFFFTTILLSSLIILCYQLSTDSSNRQINISDTKEISNSKMGEYYKNHWSVASVPGRIADMIYSDPIKATTYTTLTLALIIGLTCTNIGVGITTAFQVYTGSTFYISLYALILAGFCVIFAVDKLISNIINPQSEAKSPKEKLKPYNINPAARFWQAIDTFLDKFYLLGMQNPISMLVFSIFYIGITVETVVPFLPLYWHNILFYFVTGIANPSAGLLFAGICTGWFIGLFFLTAGDILARGHNSGMVGTIKYIKNNAIDVLLFTFLLIFSANLIAGTSLAHICGRWVILGLVTINFKPLLAIADFMSSPRKSIIGSSFSLVLMPVNIILYPGELIKYLVKKSLQILFGILKHFLIHVPLVLLKATFEIITHLLRLCGLKSAAKYVSDANIDLYSFAHKVILEVKIFSKFVFNKMTNSSNTLGKLCHVSFAILASIFAYTGMFYIWSGALPKIAILSWVSVPTSFVSGLIGINAATTCFAILGSFIVLLCTHQLLCKKEKGSEAEHQFTLAQQIIFSTLTAAIVMICNFSIPAYPFVISATMFLTVFAVIAASFACNSDKMPIRINDNPNNKSSSSETIKKENNATQESQLKPLKENDNERKKPMKRGK